MYTRARERKKDHYTQQQTRLARYTHSVLYFSSGSRLNSRKNNQAARQADTLNLDCNWWGGAAREKSPYITGLWLQKSSESLAPSLSLSCVRFSEVGTSRQQLPLSGVIIARIRGERERSVLFSSTRSRLRASYIPPMALIYAAGAWLKRTRAFCYCPRSSPSRYIFPRRVFIPAWNVRKSAARASIYVY